ncbi:Adenosine kinase 2-like protein [Tribolium castaneum]|uniref:Adenosine kinase n=1 Tax=Tribolium castaneum TaxID=7070 RepID=A0A139WCU9_TRICA|nr:PREDICTED: adenosine kinase 2 isoform X2 [Tribolium castaneum]KYB25746.1 Adenosine kinase 2-like protein [Tribolium castaneum]|eukprot:XP_001808010.2 PREDICTED: adenosine kinase 2 isoform X2 [Tribolium castaneum]
MELNNYRNSTNNDSSRRSVVFLGSPLTDITANVDREFLRKYNLEPDNAYVVDETRRPIFDEIGETAIQVGGSVTNTVRMFTKLRGFPELVTYLGSVGLDEKGKFVKTELEKEGLGRDLTEIAGGSTGKVAVLVWGTTRTLVTDLGASRTFSLDEDKWAKITRSSFVYFSGFFISVSFPSLVRIVEQTDKTICFNLGAPFLCSKYPQEMTYLYKNASLVVGNESEHRAFAKINNLESHDLLEVVMATNKSFPKSRVVIVTRGGGTVVVVTANGWQEFAVGSLSDEKIVDTSGAGDAFIGGFLAGWVDDATVADCAKSGILAARRVIQTVGFNL